ALRHRAEALHSCQGPARWVGAAQPELPPARPRQARKARPNTIGSFGTILPSFEMLSIRFEGRGAPKKRSFRGHGTTVGEVLQGGEGNLFTCWAAFADPKPSAGLPEPSPWCWSSSARPRGDSLPGRCSSCWNQLACPCPNRSNRPCGRARCASTPGIELRHRRAVGSGRSCTPLTPRSPCRLPP